MFYREIVSLWYQFLAQALLYLIHAEYLLEFTQSAPSEFLALEGGGGTSLFGPAISVCATLQLRYGFEGLES